MCTLAASVTRIALAWIDWVSGETTPCWVRLDVADDDLRGIESVWIAAGRWDRDRFAIASEEVTVIFDRAEAERTEIMK